MTAPQVPLPPPTNEWWAPLLSFAIKALVGVGISRLELAEYTIFGVDIILLIAHVVRAGLRAWRMEL